MDAIYSFGYWVRRRRKALDITQDQLARRVGCAPVTIRKIESDERRPSLQVATLLADALAIPDAERAAFLQAARAETPSDRLEPPAALAVSLPATVLPSPANPLIGRDRAVSEVVALLRQPHVRLLTLTGAGGTGKTRLMLAVAGVLGTDAAFLPDGLCFVDLSPLTDAQLVLPLVAQALELTHGGGEPLDARVQRELRQRRMLLVLDNCEHLPDVTALVAAWLSAAPHLRILATSRAPLKLRGEHEYAVVPLATPPADAATHPDTLLTYPAVQLFFDRARAVRADLPADPATITAIAAVCVQLDGLPLAIELAAARVKRYAPAELHQQLTQSGALGFLAIGPRDLPPRQRTLRAVMQWSYDLLTPAEQAAFRALGVFAGGFTLASAAAVVELPPDESLADVVESLVDKSLLLVADGPRARLTMLTTLQVLALELLGSHNEHTTLRARHTAYVLALAERAAPRLTGSEQVFWLTTLDQELGNLRLALDTPALPQLATALWWYWYLRGALDEGLDWLDRAIAAAHNDPLLQARAMYRAAALCWRQGNYRRAAELAERSLACCSAASQPVDQAFALGIGGIAALMQGDPQRALQRAQQAAALVGTTPELWPRAMTEIILGVASRFQDQPAAAHVHLNAALQLFQQLGDRWGEALTLGERGLLALSELKYAQAEADCRAAIAITHTLGDRASRADLVNRLMRIARLREDYAAAHALLQEHIALLQHLSDRSAMAFALWEAAALATARGNHVLGARIFAAAAALSAQINLLMAPQDRQSYLVMQQPLGSVSNSITAADIHSNEAIIVLLERVAAE